MSARTLPKPRLPTGPAHKMANIYYADRNFRSLVTPPEVVFEASAKGLESGQEGLGPPRKKPVTPGFSFNWRTGKPNTQ
ncbi:NADH dehydrogenase [ubiquinone] 1 alpha subcomplex subunit 7-like [Babylonia areolata]|uniref:NADH dehydrogenase [ubiquinone] 1 alpha subcomplex subunit 7-like n=1 Tax=Babylonia areolata TaxID=304850 RepID=UPI003FD5FDC1